MKITSPVEFFGCKPGSDRVMIHWDKLVAYYELVATQSKRIRLEHMGKTSDGNPFINLVISSESNIENLERYREISMKLSDARGLSEGEVAELAKEGKAICMQSYGLHSNEVGGPQMCPLLVYDLITATEGDLYEILQNVIFVMVPCSEPDGEIIFTNWYYKNLGTEHEGCISPYLRHMYAGHANNRDALHETVVESRYLIDLMVRRYMPQAFQDHHHQCPGDDRMSIAPPTSYLQQSVSPLLYRELSYYGAAMARELEKAGRRGIVSGDEKFDAFPSNTFYGCATIHNIAGMLTESADVRIATPYLVTPKEVLGNSHIEPSIQCPSPWEPGWWHLSDIVSQMYLASVALLKTMAREKERVLSDMALKGLRQTERGKADKKQAYLIPVGQHDHSACHTLLTMLDNHRVEMFVADEDFIADGVKYSKGTVIVPLAQPKYAVAEVMLGRIEKVENSYAQNNKESSLGEGFYSCYGENMGVEIHTANQKLDVKCSAFRPGVWQERELPLPGCENASFIKANELIQSGVQLYRDKDGSFYDEPDGKRKPVRGLRVGLLKLTCTWNEEEGFTRNLLRKYKFPFRIIMDEEIRERKITDIDVLVVPGDYSFELWDGDNYPQEKLPEFHRGFGSGGAQNIIDFVKGGGRVIAWERSLEYFIKLFELPIDIVDEEKFSVFGATLNFDTFEGSISAGMQSSGHIFANHCRAMNIRGGADVEGWHIAARFCEENIVMHGKTTGTDVLKGSPCVLRVPVGSGDLILYSFDPKVRAQNAGAYKLWFNAMYK